MDLDRLKSDQKLLTKKQAAQKLEVLPETLQYLCDRYALVPVLNAAGEASYAEFDLSRLEEPSLPYKISKEEFSKTTGSSTLIHSLEGSSDGAFGSLVRLTAGVFSAFDGGRKKTFSSKKRSLAVIAITLLLLLGIQQIVVKAFPKNTDLAKVENEGEVLAATTSKLKLTGSVVFGLPVVARQNLTVKKDLRVEGKSVFIGDITAPKVVYSLIAGQNIVISGDPQNPTISAEASGVTSFQGLTGDIELLAGTDIAIDGLTINDISTLETVIARGDCAGCITDAAVVNTITIDSGGTVNAAAIKNGVLEVGVGGTGLTEYVTGDLLYADSSSTLTTLPVGTAGQFLTVDGTGLPVWDTITSFAVATVEEGDAVVSALTNTLDFLAGDFDLSVSPVGEVNIQLASTLTSVDGVDGSFNVGGSTLSFTGAGTVMSAAASSLTIDSGTTGALNLGTGNNAKTIKLNW